MTIVRVRFERREAVKYLSHLEIMKAFQRAVRRTGLVASYSQGFHPQLKIVFGLPLQVGTVSRGEYADLMFDREYPPSLVVENLNHHLPLGFPVLGGGLRTIRTCIMADIAYADYQLTLNRNIEGIARFLTESSVIPIHKKTKKIVRETDIRPYIIQAQTQTPESGKLNILVRAGRENLNMKTLLEAMQRHCDPDLRYLSVIRNDLFVQRGGKPTDPLSPEALEREEP